MSETLLEMIDGKCLSLHKLLLEFVDFMHFPKKSFLRHLAEHCSDEGEKKNLLYLSSRAGSADYMKLANQHISLLDFLFSFPTCKPTLECLFSHVPLLHPRFFSVCNAPSREKIEFIYSTTEFSMPDGTKRLGVCSNWLESRKQKDNWRIFPRITSHKFHLPERNSKAIMICAGTGVSPFVGFLRTLAAEESKLAFSWLFFGFRHLKRDFLFREELEAFIEKGILDKLTISTSREPEHPKYVQDAFKANSKAIYQLMSKGEDCFIYICGDELSMVKDINDCIQQMLIDHGGVGKEEAQEIVKSWNTTRRIRRDIWV
jgi:sulfite reductase alpha subunit-like flavoprotein